MDSLLVAWRNINQVQQCYVHSRDTRGWRKGRCNGELTRGYSMSKLTGIKTVFSAWKVALGRTLEINCINVHKCIESLNFNDFRIMDVLERVTVYNEVFFLGLSINGSDRTFRSTWSKRILSWNAWTFQGNYIKTESFRQRIPNIPSSQANQFEEYSRMPLG